MMKLIFSSIFTFIISFGSLAQQGYQAELMNGDYKTAIQKAEQAIETNKKDSIAYYVLGLSNTRLKNHEKAIEYLNLASENGLYVPAIQFNLAVNYVQLDDQNKALDLLETAANSGAAQYFRLDSPDFKKLAEHPRFKALKQQMFFNAFPCEANEDYRRFDFWIGEWDVYSGGVKVAESSITKSHGGCAILEDYQTLRGIIGGNSISLYDSQEKKWKQTYADGQGRVSHYVEVDEVYEGELKVVSKTNPNNWLMMTFFENKDGSVRQLMESSQDKGKNWSVVFDGHYKNKESK